MDRKTATVIESLFAKGYTEEAISLVQVIQCKTAATMPHFQNQQEVLLYFYNDPVPSTGIVTNTNRKEGTVTVNLRDIPTTYIWTGAIFEQQECTDYFAVPVAILPES